MPRTFIQAAGMDMYRDDAIIYRTMLREHGVQARLKVYPGVPHGHANLYPGLKASREARVDTLEGFGWLLVRGEEVGRERIEETIKEVGGQGKHEGAGGK
jgi:acetyl esterase/lipase